MNTFVMDSEFHTIPQRDLGSSSSNELAYVPQVVFEKIPKIGQVFESLDESQKYYNEYARLAGFSVRNYSSKRNKCNEIIRKEFVCFKEGIRHEERSKANCSRKRGLTREGCKAKMTVVKKGACVFVVSQFNEIHNHILTTPRKVHMLRSHRSMSNAKKALKQQFVDADFPIHKQISIFEIQSGGIENIGCIEKDFNNAQRDEVKFYAGHDAQMLFERAYNAFGDVLVFDTNYSTNRYGLIFAPFVGVNHHGQGTLLACAFLSDETTESFLWLLHQLLTAMSAGAPKMIITD
ncbi:protein FAR1-RELATED SEQUENCE 5-like [Tripterygium wilfordii]|uniref:protein FAR1-RELATED SEQUENCE 5-like n=1 Tax=Tripterygium wilfordii TaxID=458696 RepID=UPI0018F840CB|nr:protein FAR1-RELATED SEQUENCE 5-like [Tripterygium wilfordii]